MKTSFDKYVEERMKDKDFEKQCKDVYKKIKKADLLKKIAMNAADILRDVDSDTLRRSQECTPNISRFDLSTATGDGITRCARSMNSHEQRVQMIDFNYILPEEVRAELDPNISFEELRNLHPEILESDLLVFCSCPSYLYGGFKYIDTQLDFALEPESRFPEIKNPSLAGTVCKHLAAFLNRFFK